MCVCQITHRYPLSILNLEFLGLCTRNMHGIKIKISDIMEKRGCTKMNLYLHAFVERTSEKHYNILLFILLTGGVWANIEPPTTAPVTGKQFSHTQLSTGFSS